MSSSYEKRKASFRASKGSFSKNSRNSVVSAKRSVQEIKKIARSTQETKYIIGSTALTPFDVPAVTLMNGVAIGDDAYTRTGNKLQMQSLEIRGYMAATDSTVSDTGGFIAIVLDREANGAQATTGLIYDTSVVAGNDPTMGLRNVVYNDRFKVLWRQDIINGFYYGGTTQNGSGLPGEQMFHKFIDLTKLKDSDSLVKYLNNASTIAGMQAGALLLLVCPSNQTAFGATADYPVHRFSYRINFKDA